LLFIQKIPKQFFVSVQTGFPPGNGGGWRSAAFNTPTVPRLAPLLLTICAAFSPAFAQTPSTPPASTPAPDAPTRSIDPTTTAWRAMSRFGYGPAPADLPDAAGAAWALRQLDAAVAASREAPRLPPELAAFNAPLPQLFDGWKAEREARRMVRQDADAASARKSPSYNFTRDRAREAAGWRLAACSRADVETPLLARMTEFWFNHLNVFTGKGSVRPFVGHYVLNAIRPHALGRYEDLLLATARHPAMLYYLDQNQSVAEGAMGRVTAALSGRRAGGLNENYARELMELHTLGVNGGYTQADVRELARILTGWTVDPEAADGFRFAARLHDDGAKTLLGQPFNGNAPGGQAEGEAAIRMLARQPATARRISLRLAQWFVADQPPPALVDRLARRYLATQGDIASVMRTLIESPETWAADARLFKTPMDYACSVLAATGGANDGDATRQALGFLAGAGQPMHGWQTPDGYKVDAATWLSPEALSRRADFAFAAGRRAGDGAVLQPWLAPATRARIAREPANLQAGLALASPEFMSK